MSRVQAREGTIRRAVSRTATPSLMALVWAGTAARAMAQAMNPAPPSQETAPAGSNSTATNWAATDFNWVWLSLVVLILALGIWYLARRRSATPPR